MQHNWLLYGILGSLLSLIAWLGYYYTSTGHFDSKKETFGIITETTDYRSAGSIRQMITYVYEVNNEWYSDRLETGKGIARQEVGFKVKISYSEKRPQFGTVEAYYSHDVPFYNRFECLHDNGRIELSLMNGVFHKVEYGHYGKFLRASYGIYQVSEDDIVTLEPIEAYQQSDFEKKYPYKATGNVHEQTLQYSMELINNELEVMAIDGKERYESL